MAVVESIPEKNQTPSAQKGVLDYCMQPSKTLDEDEQLAYMNPMLSAKRKRLSYARRR